MLFECSLEATKGDSPNWQKAEALFRLAKNTDALRLNIINLVEGEQSGEEVTNSPRFEVLKDSPSPTDFQKKLTPISKNIRKKKDDYPKYSFRGDLLVKTGLGRDRRSEYEHAVPQNIFDQIIKRLTELSKTKKNFTADDVQNVLDCPSYQTYIVLSFLKNRGLLVIPRRGSYGFKGAKTFTEDIAMSVNELKSI